MSRSGIHICPVCRERFSCANSNSDFVHECNNTTPPGAVFRTVVPQTTWDDTSNGSWDDTAQTWNDAEQEFQTYDVTNLEFFEDVLIYGGPFVDFFTEGFVGKQSAFWAGIANELQGTDAELEGASFGGVTRFGQKKQLYRQRPLQKYLDLRGKGPLL